MSLAITELDAHEQPSDALRAEWKSFAKADQKDLDYSKIDDIHDAEKIGQFCVAGVIPAEQVNRAFDSLYGDGGASQHHVQDDAPIYYHPLVPGVFPNVPRASLAVFIRRANKHVRPFDCPVHHATRHPKDSAATHYPPGLEQSKPPN